MSNLSKHLEGKFEMVGVRPGKIRLKDGSTIDTRTCSAAVAEKAVKNGSTFIRKVEKQEAKGSDSTSAKKSGK